jgi:transcriptional regulator with XRE-family HTH domain
MLMRSENTGVFGSLVLNYELLAADFIRALRGKRSQTGLSRTLGYRSNIVHRWESGQCWPSAVHFLRRCKKLLDVSGAFAKLFQRRPAWLEPREPVDARLLGAFLEELRGGTPIVEIAKLAQINRYTVSRWLKGSAEPRLPDFFRMVQATSRRLLDLLSHWVDLRGLPSAREEWQRLERARALAYEEPWAHAMLRALQLERCSAPAREAVPWLAERLGITPEAAERGLAALRSSGQIARRNGRWIPTRVERLDTGQHPERARELKLHWTRVALERMERGDAGSFGYSLFEVSHADLKALRDLHLDYVRAMQHIIANSRGTECVGLYCAQLLDLAKIQTGFGVDHSEKRSLNAAVQNAGSRCVP